jgi:exosome complex component RRP42
MFTKKNRWKKTSEAVEGNRMSDSYKVVSKITAKKIIEAVSQNKRHDGRGLLDYREIKTEIGFVGKASGSAFVSIGKTKILVGVKVETGEPYSDKPDAGVLTVNAELTPLASPRFEPGPPSEDAIELARVVDRGIRESKAVDLKTLCITPGKNVFVVFVDLNILDHDGNLFDTAALASILALMNAKIQKYSVTKDGQLKFKKGTTPLPLANFPVEVTIAKIGDKLVVDPSLDEEAVIDARITIALGKDDEVCAVQKSLLGTFSPDEVSTALDIATKKANELRENVLKGVGGWLSGKE